MDADEAAQFAGEGCLAGSGLAADDEDLLGVPVLDPAGEAVDGVELFVREGPGFTLRV